MTGPTYDAVRRLRALTRKETAKLSLEELQTLRDELLDWATRVDEHLDELVDMLDRIDMAGMFPGLSWPTEEEEEDT